MHPRTRAPSLLTVAVLAMGLGSSPGCRRDSTLDDVPPAPGDPYSNATTPPERMPESASGAERDGEPKLAPPPPRADAPPPQDTARPQAGPGPRQPTASAPQKPAPDPAPAEPTSAPPATAKAPPAKKAPPPAKKEPDVEANRGMVSDFGLCRAKCDSDPDLNPENAPTCKLACINDTAPKDTFAMGCKRDCMRDASRCYDPCESSGSASCRQGCERTLLSCMNDCDVKPPG